MNALSRFVRAACAFGPLGTLRRQFCHHHLAAADGRTVARAAARIADESWRGYEGDLIAALTRWSTRAEAGADVVRLFLLDALVRTNANVPFAVLPPLLHGLTEAAAFVLLARSVRRHELELLAGFVSRAPHDGGGGRDLRWVAEGNLLCAFRTPGFAAALLRGMDWSLTIDVVASGQTVRSSAPPPSWADAGGSLGGHEGFPPLPAYSLVAASDGDELLAVGPPAIGFRRQLATALVPTGLGFTNQEQQLRAHWLGALLAAEPVTPVVAKTVPFAAAASWSAAVEQAMRACHDARRQLVQALARAGELSPGEVAAPMPPLRVLVRDCRAAGAPLPDVPGAAVMRRVATTKTARGAGRGADPGDAGMRRRAEA
jgi:hypothetical protein